MRTMQRVLVGLSGGVDSFVTAWLLRQQGYEVTGAHLLLQGEETGHSAEKVEALCREIAVPLHFIDGRRHFEQLVVAPFTEGYRNGATPSPCAVCNSFVKWHLLQEAADRLGIEYIATGHYIRLGVERGHHYFFKGVDARKDQSYFLWGVPEKIIRRALTPLGGLTKEQVKKIAAENGYEHLARQSESMGVCFLRGKDYRDFIRKREPSALSEQAGEIVTTTGEVIGNHPGVSCFTIGQKRDIPSWRGEPMYVREIRPRERLLVVAPKTGLHSRQLHVSQLHLIDPDEITAPDISVKIRGIGLNPEGYAQCKRVNTSEATILLSAPAWAPAPGQPVVFYRGERLIGGGILTGFKNELPHNNREQD